MLKDGTIGAEERYLSPVVADVEYLNKKVTINIIFIRFVFYVCLISIFLILDFYKIADALSSGFAYFDTFDNVNFSGESLKSFSDLNVLFIDLLDYTIVQRDTAMS